MTTCHGCNSPIEPIAAIRTYHSGCDPQGRVEMLERELQQALRQWKMHAEMSEERDLSTEASTEADMYRAARAALEYRPAQMKGRE
jgi:hypothetical protein